MANFTSEVTVFEAVVAGDIDTLTEIFQRNPKSIHIKDGRGYRAAHIAAETGRSNVIQWLGRNKFNLNEESQTGYAPIHVACDYGHLDCVLALKMGGAKLDILSHPDEANATHMAARHGHIGIVQMLIAAGVKANEKDKYGHTPIEYAASNGHSDMVNFLVKALNIKAPEIKDISKHPDNRHKTQKEKQAEDHKMKQKAYKEIVKEEKEKKTTFLELARSQ